MINVPAGGGRVEILGRRTFGLAELYRQQLIAWETAVGFVEAASFFLIAQYKAASQLCNQTE